MEVIWQLAGVQVQIFLSLNQLLSPSQISLRVLWHLTYPLALTNSSPLKPSPPPVTVEFSEAQQLVLRWQMGFLSSPQPVLQKHNLLCVRFRCFTQYIPMQE